MNMAKKQKKVKLTLEVLKQLQDAMNDSIKPDYKDGKKDGKKRNKKAKKGKSSNGSAERNQPETAVPVQSEGS